MEYWNKQICVTIDELTGGTDAVIASYDTLKKNVQRGNIVCVRQGKGEGRYALYAYSSLPNKYKMKFVEKYGNPEDVLREQQLRDLYVKDEAAHSYYAAYEYELNGNPTHLTEALIEEYTINASVIKMLCERLNELRAMSNALGSSKRSDLWEICHEQSEKLRGVMHHTLPGNLARLKAKMNEYKKNGYACLISGKLGNSNTLKITDVAARRLIALKRSKTPVMNDTQILARFNEDAERNGWKPLKSIRSMKQWFALPEIEPLWHDAVFGEMSAHQKFDRRHKTQLPTMRDALWYGDGTKLNLYYRDENGKVRTTSVYEVIDAYSECFLGFCIRDTEDFEAQYMAYRMAVQVAKHKPYEIVHDNQGGHKKEGVQDYFDNICLVHRTTAPYNGRSKTIESVFGRFQQQILAQDWRFTGQNVTATKATSHPNMEFISANKDKLYTLDELKAAYVKARTEWNEAVHPATGQRRIDMYNGSVNAETPSVTVEDMVEMFWIWTDKPATFTASGIEITVNKVKHTYEVYAEAGVPDLEWRRRNTYRQFHVKYDPYDFGSIRLYRKDKAGELRFERTAEPYMVIHRAIQEQTEGEAKFIREQQNAIVQERIERQVVARQIEKDEGVLPEQNGLTSPRLLGLNKDAQAQIERRVGIYRQEPIELSLGRVTKKVSNIDWEEVSAVKLNDEKKMAGKL